MAEYNYNFSKLTEYLENHFVYPSDCLEVLEVIENTLVNLNQAMILQPEVVKAIECLEKLRLALGEGIPNDRKRL